MSKNFSEKNSEGLRELVQDVVQEVLNSEMENFLDASPYERTENRRGYRAGYYTRRMETRIGTLTLRIPQDRQGNFKTELFERYQRSEKALVSTMMEMYIEGVSTRKVANITEVLCGTEFSASLVSSLKKNSTKHYRNLPRDRSRMPTLIYYWMPDTRRCARMGLSKIRQF